MVDEDVDRIAELERENAELNVELGREARIAGLATVTMHEQYAKLARLQAVVRAAKDLDLYCLYGEVDPCRTGCFPCRLDAARNALEDDDLKGVK